MAERTIVLGPVTAYGEARRGGYTGSKEEFEQILAGLGNINEKQDKLSGTSNQYVGFDANGNAVAKTPSITPSPDPFSSHAILDESGVANLVMGETTTKVDKVVSPTAGNIATLTPSGGIEDSGTSVAALQNVIENITPKRTAANAPSSSSFSVLCDTALAGQAKPKLYGKSVVINQLVLLTDATQTNAGVTITRSAANGTITFSGTATAATATENEFAKLNIPTGHKVFACGVPSAADGKIFIRVGRLSGSYIGSQTSSGLIFDVTDGVSLSLSITNGANCNGLVFYPQIIDLTAIFTAAELTAIGTDVSKLKTAWLKKFGYPLPQYIPYNAGSIVSNNATYQMHGKNAWGGIRMAQDIYDNRDPNYTVTIDTTNKTVFYEAGAVNTRSLKTGGFYPNTQYTLLLWGKNTASGTYTNLRFAYADGTSSGVGQFQTSGSNSWCVLTSDAGKSVIAVKGLWVSGDVIVYYDECGLFEGAITASEFEAYYNGGSVTADDLNGIGTAVDTQDAEGQIVRKIGSVDLGTLTWSYGSGYFTGFTLSQTALAAPLGLCPKYTVVQSAVANLNDKECRVNGGAVYIKDTAYTDAATFKTAMNGVPLAYELATPTTDSTSAASIQTQAGYNTLEPVAGDVQSGAASVEYSLDIVKYIDNKVSDLTALISSL